MVFPGTTICRVMASFDNFIFLFIFQFTVFLFAWQKVGDHGPPCSPVEADPDNTCILTIFCKFWDLLIVLRFFYQIVAKLPGGFKKELHKKNGFK